MKIVVAGGTGFLGQPLVRALGAAGNDVVVLTRTNRGVAWNPDGTAGAWARELDGAGAVVNLAGESIAAKRWTPAQKKKILESRTLATRSLVAAIHQVASPPPLLVNGSAVGFYGPHGDEAVTEDTAPGSDFLAGVCRAWEAEATRVPAATRTVFVRTGLVLEKDGGALPPMLPPFKFGVGGPVGSGRQYWPWIHRDDWVRLVQWTIGRDALTGPVNATAPEPVTNREFARELGRALHRPALMPAPGFALRLLLGEMAEGLILSGQRAVPQRAQRGGFSFKYTSLSQALGAIF